MGLTYVEIILKSYSQFYWGQKEVNSNYRFGQ